MVVIREIQTIHQAETQYQSQFGKYAATLNELGPPTSGGPGPQAADLIPDSLAAGEKDGFIFTLTATPQGYTVSANPKVYNSSRPPHVFLRPDHDHSSELVGQSLPTRAVPELK